MNIKVDEKTETVIKLVVFLSLLTLIILQKHTIDTLKVENSRKEFFVSDTAQYKDQSLDVYCKVAPETTECNIYRKE